MSLYLHVPFCRSRCIYCGFYSNVLTSGGAELENYRNALLEQVKTSVPLILGEIPTIYFGGGTPSLLAGSIAEVLDEIRAQGTVTEDAEITVEANPESLSAESLTAWINAGVTRVSLGVQAFDDEVLAMFARAHDVKIAKAALGLLQESGIDFSLDLIAGIPGVTDEQWTSWLEAAVAADACHISIYALTVEEHTPLEVLIRQQDIAPVDDDRAADQLEIAERFLEKNGISRYEISNYARPGKRSRHNCRYWQGGQYLGLGPGAASMVEGEDNVRHRFVLYDEISDYLGNPCRKEPVEDEILSEKEARLEDVMLGMRLTEGVRDEDVFAVGITAVMEKCCEQGLVYFDADTKRYRLTERGWLLGNEVFGAIWCSQDNC
ncbi:MAG: radical SAM family heme chaperone HemW [Coriobacteriia bacterium]|nr:radical SAM family heme chaperone HemW [Coriobacteriia bacterium]